MDQHTAAPTRSASLTLTRAPARPPRSHRPPNQQTSTPTLDLSIALATRNRARVLRLTLESLTRLDSGGVNWELVVVDNGSTDDTQLVLHSFTARLPLRYVYEPRLGKSNALNRVARELQGRLICFTDNDILFPPQWLKTLLACVDRYPDVGVFGGPVSPHWTRSTRAAYLRHPYARQAYTICHLGDRARPYPPESWPAGANTVYRHHVLDPEPFDPAMGPIGTTRLIGNDTALAKRLAARGERLWYLPELGVQHVIQPAQMVPPFLWRRAYQRAKTLALTGSLAPVTTLGGVTLWMIHQLARRAARLLAAWTCLTPSPRIHAEVDLADVLGFIVGARLAHRHGGPRP